MQRATLPTSHQLVISNPFACQWFFTKKIWKYNIGYFTSQRPTFCEAKKECTLTRFSSSKRRVPYGEKASSEEFKLPFAKICLAALKNKNKGLLCRPKRSPLFFILCCHFLIKRRGVKNFLEPSKIRFKRGFFFTINQLQSIKKAPQVTLRFLKMRNV